LPAFSIYCYFIISPTAGTLGVLFCKFNTDIVITCHDHIYTFCANVVFSTFYAILL